MGDIFEFYILSMNRHQNLILELEVRNFAIYVGLFLKNFASRLDLFVCL
jgi:hypothetical protein